MRNGLAHNLSREAVSAAQDPAPGWTIIAITGLVILWGVRMRQSGQPSLQEGIDCFRAQLVTDGLQTLGIGTGDEAIVQCLVGNGLLKRSNLRRLCRLATAFCAECSSRGCF
jgi:hypothetical protein